MLRKMGRGTRIAMGDGWTVGCDGMGWGARCRTVGVYNGLGRGDAERAEHNTQSI